MVQIAIVVNNVRAGIVIQRQINVNLYKFHWLAMIPLYYAKEILIIRISNGERRQLADAKAFIVSATMFATKVYSAIEPPNSAKKAQDKL